MVNYNLLFPGVKVQVSCQLVRHYATCPYVIIDTIPSRPEGLYGVTCPDGIKSSIWGREIIKVIS